MGIEPSECGSVSARSVRSGLKSTSGEGGCHACGNAKLQADNGRQVVQPFERARRFWTSSETSSEESFLGGGMGSA